MGKNSFGRKIWPIIILVLIISWRAIFLQTESKYPILDGQREDIQILENVSATIEYLRNDNEAVMLKVNVTNSSLKSIEIDEQSLEILRGNEWYYLKEVDSTYFPPALGVCISADEEKTITVMLSKYGTPLRNGYYRVILDTWPDHQCVIAEFEVS